MTDAEIFAAIRERKGSALTQSDVDAINAIMGVGEHGMIISKSGLDLIKSFEGCKLSAYPDPATGGDPWTIGFGTTGPGIVKGLTWTQAQADRAIAVDVSKFSDGVTNLIGAAPTTQGQFDAMVSLAYNVGLGNLRESTLMRMHKDGDYAGAAGQFLRWNRAAGKIMDGLTRRREAEAKMYRGQA